MGSSRRIGEALLFFGGQRRLVYSLTLGLTVARQCPHGNGNAHGQRLGAGHRGVHGTTTARQVSGVGFPDRRIGQRFIDPAEIVACGFERERE